MLYKLAFQDLRPTSARFIQTSLVLSQSKHEELEPRVKSVNNGVQLTQTFVLSLLQVMSRKFHGGSACVKGTLRSKLW